MNNDQIASKQDFQYGIRNIDDIRNTCTEITNKLHEKITDTQIEHLAQLREIPKEVFNNTDLFYFDENEPVDIEDKATGLLVMKGRVVFPVKTVYNEVMGFVGYDKFVQPKYMDSHTYGYRAKHTTVYGMEKMKEYLESREPIFLVEGIIDCLIIRYLGFHCLATLSSYLNNTVIAMLNKNICCYIADNDDAGINMVNRMIKPKFKNCFSIIFNHTKVKYNLEESEKDLKDVNDAFVKYGEEKLKDTLTDWTKKLIVSNDIIRSI